MKTSVSQRELKNKPLIMSYDEVLRATIIVKIKSRIYICYQ